MPPSDTAYIAIFHCPSCEEISQELYYEVNTTGWESGCASADVNENGELRDWFDTEWGNSGDTDWDGEPMYKCTECDHEMTKNQAKRSFIVYTITRETEAAFKRRDLSLQDIVNGAENQEITTEGIKSIPPEKPDYDSKKIVINRGESDTVVGFREFGTQCPKCGNIQASGDRKCQEHFHTCIECDHEFTITNLKESLENASTNTKDLTIQNRRRSRATSLLRR